jgi:hypothetical protein
MMKKLVSRSDVKAKSRRFFTWKQIFIQFEEKIAIEMNAMSNGNKSFSLASTLHGNGQENKDGLSQF